MGGKGATQTSESTNDPQKQLAHVPHDHGSTKHKTSLSLLSESGLTFSPSRFQGKWENAMLGASGATLPFPNSPTNQNSLRPNPKSSSMPNRPTRALLHRPGSSGRPMAPTQGPSLLNPGYRLCSTRLNGEFAHAVSPVPQILTCSLLFCCFCFFCRLPPSLLVSWNEILGPEAWNKQSYENVRHYHRQTQVHGRG
jgi:hypothetical protein